MNEERITRLPPFMFFVYWGFSILNFWIHYNNYYKGGLSDTDDYILYAIEIAICIAVIIVTGKYSCFSGIPIIMKAMIFVDWLQVLIVSHCKRGFYRRTRMQTSYISKE